MLFETLIRVIAIPGGLTLAAFVLARFLPGALRTSLRSAGVAVGFALGYLLIAGLPMWPVGGSPSGLLVASLVCSFWPTFEHGVVRRLWFSRYLLVAALLVVMLKPFIFGQWDSSYSLSVLLLLATSGVFVWWAIEGAAARIPPSSSLVVFIAVGTGLSLLMLAEGGALVSQLAGVYCSILGSILALSLLSFFQIKREFAAFAVLMLICLLTAHYFYVESEWRMMVLLLSPLLLLPLRTLVKRPVRPMVELVGMGVVSLLPVAYVIWRIYPALLEL